ncbi:hypothetical protein Poli38472_013201 [Pythium oligandrum]|uniref:Elicitor-like transglutaminase n=1 Tax=Pythium oligandrum TaxID=41045 RepID=A0A8K1C2N3_PYTOL|nr:hypothetical protein Poli38472_013201 [Pythium oligandrum]|eukprot:TMW55310.1 hypothetical protein Poli38472_013201 [Pythium oligandrum]
MVRVELFSAALLATLALLSGQADADAIKLNPITPVGDTVKLGHKHPAFARPLPANAAGLNPIIPDPSEDDDDDDEFSVRSLDTTGANATGSSKDITRIETHFKTPMVRKFSDLQKYSKVVADPAPWPSSYWPVYQDGINVIWNSKDPRSATEKYAIAFGYNVTDMMNKVSAINGIDSMKEGGTECEKDEECEPLKDGSVCGKRAGAKKGYCTPTWYGICHAWSPAAIEEPEPRCAVTKNNVTFQPLDIKALVTQLYDGSNMKTVFTGARFNGPDQPENLDEYGRFTDAARRDVGPGFFHLAIHNIMGIQKKSFIVDATAGAEVWNQPVYSYEVVETEEMEPDEAAQTYFNTSSYSVFNKHATKVVYTKTYFNWVVESTENKPFVSTGLVAEHTAGAIYEYLLELDAESNVIGGEWLGDSKKQHPDFLWFPSTLPAADLVTSVGLKYKDVRELIELSTKCEQPTNSTTPVPTTVTPVPTTVGSGSQDYDDEIVGSPEPSRHRSASGSDDDEVGDSDDDDDDDDSDSGKVTSSPMPTLTPIPAPAPSPITGAPSPMPDKVTPKPTPSATPSTASPSPAPGKPKPSPSTKPGSASPAPSKVTPKPSSKPGSASPAPSKATPKPSGKNTPSPAPTKDVGDEADKTPTPSGTSKCGAKYV